MPVQTHFTNLICSNAVLCISCSMVILLDLLATRFPMDIITDVEFISKNIYVYVVRISPSDDTGKMCFVTTDKRSRLKYIDCLPCQYNSSCEKQMVGDLLIVEFLVKQGPDTKTIFAPEI